jgi:hypothetical protein
MASGAVAYDKSPTTPRRLTVVALLVVLGLTPVFVVSSLAVGIPFMPYSSAGATATPSTPAILGATAGGQMANTSSLCAHVPRYEGEDSTDPSNTNVNESFPILSMKPGQMAEICVSFYNHDDPQPVTLNLGEMVSIGNFQSQTFVNGTTVTKFVSASPKITVTPAQPTLVLSGSTAAPFPAGGGGGTLVPNSATIAFAVNATESATGTYFIDIEGASPASCQGEFRFAVGLDFTQQNATGPYFALPPGVGGCAAGLGVVHDHILGVQGITITYLACNMFSCDINRPAA